MTATPRPADNAPMVEHALWYASMGWSIMPLHQPLFDQTGKVCGCTCEAWKRENRDPEYKCDTPGKHPIHGGWEGKATTDADQIRRWWRAWPTANIGLAVGKSGLLTLDLDAYKDTFDGDNLLTRADEDTVTQLSGGGGSHLLYAMPPDKTWGNHRGDLPAGIDVRGHGGMQVLAPSLHPSGNRYQWELDYGPDEIEPRAIPDWLATILDDAATKAKPARAVHFDQVTTARPDLAAWHLAAGTIDAINTAPAKGGRSEHDMRVVVALCYAGLNDTDVLSVFEHYPIGTHGKFAGAGQQYLAHTIGKARAYVDAHPATSSGVIDPEEVRAEVDYLRGWVKSNSFADYVPAELQSAAGYRTDSTDTKIAHAVLDVCHERGTWRIYVSRRTLALRAGLGSHETAQAALQRLAGWFVALHDDGKIELVARRSTSLTQIGCGGERLVDLRATNYGEMMADDVFLTGASKTAKNRVNRDARRVEQMMVDTGDMTPEQAAGVAWFKELWAATESGLGESGARVVDAILTHGDMTRSELVEVTGKTKSAIGRITLRLERLGLLETDQESPRAPKVYGLADDWQDKIERLRPTLKTHKLGVERRKRNEEDLIAFCDREQRRKGADEEHRRNLAKRRARAEKRLAELVAQLDEGINVDQWVATPNATHARFDYAPILAERRQERFLTDSLTLSELTATPGRLLWRDELAKGRHAAGRLGVNFADYVESQSLQMAAD